MDNLLTHKYETSRDYELLYELAKSQRIVCFVTPKGGRGVVKDVAQTQATIREDGSLSVGARGICYIHGFAFVGKTAKEDFVDLCRGADLEFIVPPEEKKEKAKDLLYGVDGQEYLDSCPYDCVQNDLANGEATFPITVFEYDRQVATIDEEYLIYEVIRELDEEYGDPDGDDTEISDGMKKAVRDFTKAITDEYFVWLCRQTGNTLVFKDENNYDFVEKEK